MSSPNFIFFQNIFLLLTDASICGSIVGKRGDLLGTGTRLSLVESVEMPVPAYIRGRHFCY